MCERIIVRKNNVAERHMVNPLRLGVFLLAIHLIRLFVCVHGSSIVNPKLFLSNHCLNPISFLLVISITILPRFSGLCVLYDGGRLGIVHFIVTLNFPNDDMILWKGNVHYRARCALEHMAQIIRLRDEAGDSERDRSAN